MRQRRASSAGASWVIDALEAGVAVISLSPSHRGRIEFASTTLAAMAGATVEEMLGQPCSQLVTPTEREQAGAYFEKIAAGTPQQFVCHLAGPYGTALVADVNAQVVRVDGDDRALLEFRRWRSPRRASCSAPTACGWTSRAARCGSARRQSRSPGRSSTCSPCCLSVAARSSVTRGWHAPLGGVQQVGSSRNFIEAAISRLRRAMQSAGATAVIETVAGHGYMIR